MSAPSTEPLATNHDFARLAEPLRAELRLHCYRLLGSLHEADDVVQETYLRAWRSFERFDGRAFRAWMYRIATNTSLNALERRKSDRLMPDQLGPAVPPGALGAPADISWLEPFPTALISDATPEAGFASRETVQLAFVAALQVLPARQRAALMLCDVLGWSALDAAEALETTTASINSALQRARESLSKRFPSGLTPQPTPSAQATQLLSRYLHAWESHDLDAFVALLREDATAIMPPWREWFAGRDAIRTFFEAAWKTCHGLRLVPTSANRQPAFAVYELHGDVWDAHSLHVLTLEAGLISGLTLFVEPRFVTLLGLPACAESSSTKQ